MTAGWYTVVVSFLCLLQVPGLSGYGGPPTTTSAVTSRSGRCCQPSQLIRPPWCFSNPRFVLHKDHNNNKQQQQQQQQPDSVGVLQFLQVLKLYFEFLERWRHFIFEEPGWSWFLRVFSCVLSSVGSDEGDPGAVSASGSVRTHPGFHDSFTPGLIHYLYLEI